MVRDVASWFLIGWETATLYRLGTLARALADQEMTVQCTVQYMCTVHTAAPECVHTATPEATLPLR